MLGLKPITLRTSSNRSEIGHVIRGEKFYTERDIAEIRKTFMAKQRRQAEKELVGVKEIAEKSGVTERSIRNWVQNGSIQVNGERIPVTTPFIQFGGEYFFPKRWKELSPAELKSRLKVRIPKSRLQKAEKISELIAQAKIPLTHPNPEIFAADPDLVLRVLEEVTNNQSYKNAKPALARFLQTADPHEIEIVLREGVKKPAPEFSVLLWAFSNSNLTLANQRILLEKLKRNEDVDIRKYVLDNI